MDSTIEEQFTAVYRCHRAAVERYVLRRAQPEDVGDVLAEVFLTAWRRFDQMPAEPLPWLYGVARRVLANDRRAGQRRTDLQDRLADEPRPHDSGYVEEVIARTDVAQAFDRLGGDDQEVLRLALWEELTPAEIAHVLGQKPVPVRVRLHRARRRLRKQLNSSRPVLPTGAPAAAAPSQEVTHARH
ncbi:RNA polymerase sigma factor [Streptomyces sp. NPDC102451]|uniref:RNA polymerase sigma factor n=1 Tax=Streptomyces sp. NPDC102451 TaxID=3366177 RepID=UPI003806D3BA